MKKLLLFVMMAFVFGSCMSTKVRVNSVYPKGIFLDSLNLASVMIGPVWQPVLPLIDAAAFNEKTNKIADYILDEELKIIEDYKAMLVNSLRANITTPVVTANNFISDLQDPQKVTMGVQIENKNFPVVFFSNGDINIAEFGKGKNVNRIFNNDSLKSKVAKVATECNIDNVLVAYNRLAVVNVGMFGITGNIRLESYLFLYDSKGNLIMDAYGWMKPTTIKGKDISDYKYQLDSYNILAKIMSKELVNYIK